MDKFDSALWELPWKSVPVGVFCVPRMQNTPTTFILHGDYQRPFDFVGHDFVGHDLDDMALEKFTNFTGYFSGI